MLLCYTVHLVRDQTVKLFPGEDYFWKIGRPNFIRLNDFVSWK